MFECCPDISFSFSESHAALWSSFQVYSTVITKKKYLFEVWNVINTIQTNKQTICTMYAQMMTIDFTFYVHFNASCISSSWRRKSKKNGWPFTENPKKDDEMQICNDVFSTLNGPVSTFTRKLRDGHVEVHAVRGRKMFSFFVNLQFSRDIARSWHLYS